MEYRSTGIKRNTGTSRDSLQCFMDVLRSCSCEAEVGENDMSSSTRAITRLGDLASFNAANLIGAPAEGSSSDTEIRVKSE